MKKNGDYDKMYNFFVENNQIQDNKIVIENKDAKHISQVLRMQKGEEIYVCDKQTEKRFLAKIESFEKEKVICMIIREIESTELNVKITLFQGLPKKDKMELIIQKAVELGVYNIVPVDMKNCIVKLKDEDKKISRWQEISEAAAKQSKRNIIPKIEKMINVKNLREKIKDYDLCIVAYEDENKTTLKDVLNRNKNVKNIALVIGPEGGIDKDEVKMLNENGAKTASLGKRILRTETAGISIISMITYEFEL